jgi:antitoxin MazE
MQSHVHKWGNSLGIRIPMRIAKMLHLQPGSPIKIEVEDGRLIIQAPQYDLDSMVEAITEENKHNLLLDDRQIGNEEW